MSKRWFMYFAVAVSFVAVLLIAGPTLADSAEKNILFILDASGSMQDKMGGTLKIIIAKEILSDLIDELPESANVGLLVYGNRAQNSCEIVDVAVPVKKLDREALKKALRPIEAKGKTPIAFSLRKGADVLKGLVGDKALILISDGEETCGGDPIKTAEEIKKEFGIDVVVHVIGFTVSEKERAQLAGVARAGGGTYYSADNAQELKTSLTKIKEEVVVVKKVEPPKDIFSEKFKGPDLSKGWVIINNDPDNRVIENGVMTIITAVGEPEKGTAKNVLVYKKDDLPEDYEVTTKFTTELYTIDYKYDWVGLLFWADEDSHLKLVCRLEMARFTKRLKGEEVPALEVWTYKNKNPETYYLKVEKRKFKYTAYYGFEDDKGVVEWKSLGTHTMLGVKLYPGLITYRDEGAKEVAPEFKEFTIKELK